MVKKSRIGRPKAYSDRTSTSFSCEKAVLDDFMELCWKEKTSLSEKLQTYMEEELKKAVGTFATPIAIAYDASNSQSTMRQTSLSAFANLSRIDIEEETSLIEDQSLLTRIKANSYATNKAVDRQSMVLYTKGIKT